MSMGYASGYADTVDENTVKEFCPAEFKAFMETVEQSSQSLDEVARLTNFSPIDEDEIDKDVYQAYIRLQEAFERNTGLTLDLSFHDADEEGDRYDDVNGPFWAVDGVYQITPAGKKMMSFINRVNFVTFG